MMASNLLRHPKRASGFTYGSTRHRIAMFRDLSKRDVVAVAPRLSAHLGPASSGLAFFCSRGRRRGLIPKKQEETMLKKLDNEHLNRLALAEALANMSPDDFDMRNTSRCICGHTLRMFAQRPFYFFGGWESQLRAGAALLGLSIEQARELFVPANRAKVGCDHYTHPHDAARVVRYLAATDTVDWSIAGKL